MPDTLITIGIFLASGLATIALKYPKTYKLLVGPLLVFSVVPSIFMLGADSGHSQAMGSILDSVKFSDASDIRNVHDAVFSSSDTNDVYQIFAFLSLLWVLFLLLLVELISRVEQSD